MTKPLLTQTIPNRVGGLAIKAAAMLLEDIELFGPLTKEDIRAYKTELARFDSIGSLLDPTAYRDALQNNRIEQTKQYIAVVEALLPMVEPLLEETVEKGPD